MSNSSNAEQTEPRRLRIIVSAYACGPGDEPEAGAGWSFVRAAAQKHDVWVITRERFKPAITRALTEDPELAARVTVHFIDLSPRLVAVKRRAWDVYWYYAAWQLKLARVASELHGVIQFDVAHHITFANDWLPCGINRLKDVPLVWGPVGGATPTPWRLARWLGIRGVLVEGLRALVSGGARRIWGDSVARRASVVVAQNDDVRRRFAYARRVVVEPNAAFDDKDPEVERNSGMPKVAVFVGRLQGFKGCRLAVATMADSSLTDWRLELYGSGRDRDVLAAMAENLGISDRIQFMGHRPRTEVLAAYGRANVMLFPSMHDQAGWAAGEASASGCPVVCLAQGGPPVMAGPNAFIVPITRNVVADLAQAVVRAGNTAGERYPRWSTDRIPALVNDWYADAASSVKVR